MFKLKQISILIFWRNLVVEMFLEMNGPTDKQQSIPQPRHINSWKSQNKLDWLLATIQPCTGSLAQTWRSSNNAWKNASIRVICFLGDALPTNLNWIKIKPSFFGEPQHDAKINSTTTWSISAVVTFDRARQCVRLAMRSATGDVQVMVMSTRKTLHGCAPDGTLQSGYTIGTETPLAISCSRWSYHSENDIVWRPGLCTLDL